MSSTPLFDRGQLDRTLRASNNTLEAYRAILQNGNDALRRMFGSQQPIERLVAGRAQLVDEVLRCVWERFFVKAGEDIGLVAVGGYGRGELHPHSDIDLLVLLGNETSDRYREQIEAFLAFLWDTGLEVGHSVRTIDECVREATRDVTVATNLMEARLLCGPASLFDAMREATDAHHIWPSNQFFEAKLDEQRQRHRRFHDTAYNLEPNVKESPGGLRDIQVIGWVAKRHFGAETLQDLIDHGFLTEPEYQALIRGQNFLWRVRFALHMLTQRREDRLLFDYQRTLAVQLGYRDGDHNLAVEQLMQDYYRAIMQLGRLNEMLLQLFQEAILYADDSAEPVNINKRFQARKGFIEVTDDHVFEHKPFAMLEVFLLLQQNTDLKGVRASTIRLIRANTFRIDESFRSDLRCRSLFMEIMRQPNGITRELRRMNRYGVLAAYLPSFGRIVGRMQYDLFHVYTVDEHSLFVVRNIRRFTIAAHRQEFPLCSELMEGLAKPELLYLAGLFHDIAKGRGGDHSELGSAEAIQFCLHHGLSRFDADLVAWLVRNHLAMSMTAQHKDISDPEIINEFASMVADRTHLDYLYLLTVADIRATNPNLWNSWKDALMKELYRAARYALERGLERPIEEQEHIGKTQSEARALLIDMGLSTEQIEASWRNPTADYFLYHTAEEIAWHTGAIIRTPEVDLPLVLVKPLEQRGSTEIFIYGRKLPHHFALTTSALEQLGLDIVDARIATSIGGYALHTFLVLETTGEAIKNEYRLQEIQSTLRKRLLHPDRYDTTVTRRAPRQVRHFDVPTEVSFEQDPNNARTILRVSTPDRPGLLSRVGKAFAQHNIGLQGARASTVGARAEDLFYITSENDELIVDTAKLDELRVTIISLLAE